MAGGRRVCLAGGRSSLQHAPASHKNAALWVMVCGSTSSLKRNGPEVRIGRSFGCVAAGTSGRSRRVCLAGSQPPTSESLEPALGGDTTFADADFGGGEVRQ